MSSTSSRRTTRSGGRRATPRRISPLNSSNDDSLQDLDEVILYDNSDDVVYNGELTLTETENDEEEDDEDQSSDETSDEAHEGEGGQSQEDGSDFTYNGSSDLNESEAEADAVSAVEEDNVVEISTSQPVTTSTSTSIVTGMENSTESSVSYDPPPAKIPKISPEKHSISGKSPAKKSPNKSQYDREEDTTCPICFEDFDSSGPHRLVCLACGHLFGKSCIEKWIQSEKPSKCPTCKSKTSKKAVRPLFGQCVKMRDTNDLERTKESVRVLRSENAELKVELAQFRLKLERAVADIGSKQQSSSKTPSFQTIAHRSSQDISTAASARCLDFDRNFMCLVATCNQESIFSPYGLKKFDVELERLISYHPVHTSRARYCSFSPNSTNSGPKVLSTGDDKTLCVTALNEQTVAVKINLPAAGWSCNWLADDISMNYNNCVVAGLTNGNVLLYDLRANKEPICALTEQSQPIIDVQYVRLRNERAHDVRGILTTSLRQCIFYMERRAGQAFERHVLIQDEGPISSSSYEAGTASIALTFRPSVNGYATVNHRLFQALYSPYVVTARQERVYLTDSTEQKLMTHNALFEKNGALMTVLYDQASSSLRLYDWTSSRILASRQFSPNDSNLIHITPIMSPTRQGLAALTPNKLHWLELK